MQVVGTVAVSFKVHMRRGRHLCCGSGGIHNLERIRVGEGEDPSVVGSPVHAAEFRLLVHGRFAAVGGPH